MHLLSRYLEGALYKFWSIDLFCHDDSSSIFWIITRCQQNIQSSLIINHYEQKSENVWKPSATAYNCEFSCLRFLFIVSINLRSANKSDLAFRACFKQDLQLHKTWQLAKWQYNNRTLYTAHFHFTAVQNVINCTLKYALLALVHTI